MWTEATVAKARQRLEEVCKTLSDDLGFAVDLKPMPPARFTKREVSFHVTFTASSKLLDEVEEYAWTQHCASVGLTPQDRLRTITSEGVSITLVTIEPKNTKYPIIARTSDGKRLKLPADKVQQCLGLKVLTATAAAAAQPSGQPGAEQSGSAAAAAAAGSSGEQQPPGQQQQEQQAQQSPTSDPTAATAAAAAAAAGDQPMSNKAAGSNPANTAAAAAAAAAGGGSSKRKLPLTQQQEAELRQALQETAEATGLHYFTEQLEQLESLPDTEILAHYNHLVRGGSPAPADTSAAAAGHSSRGAEEPEFDEEAAAAAWTEHCASYGLSPEHRCTSITLDNKTYILLTIKPQNKKYPVIASRVGAKQGSKPCKLPVDQVKAALGLTEPQAQAGLTKTQALTPNEAEEPEVGGQIAAAAAAAASPLHQLSPAATTSAALLPTATAPAPASSGQAAARVSSITHVAAAKPKTSKASAAAAGQQQHASTQQQQQQRHIAKQHQLHPNGKRRHPEPKGSTTLAAAAAAATAAAATAATGGGVSANPASSGIAAAASAADASAKAGSGSSSKRARRQLSQQELRDQLSQPLQLKGVEPELVDVVEQLEELSKQC